MGLGIYLHVPFCRSKCGYCDFFSKTDPEKKSAYLQALLKEINSYREQGLSADTLYIGGGTPSLLSGEELAVILSACQEVFSPRGEITLEANPDSASFSLLKAARELSVSRISFGAQSASERELSALGRRHSHGQTAAAVENARKAGFENISLDIMIGIPFQTPDSLQNTLKSFAALQPSHLSAYLLKIEEGTPFAVRGVSKLCPDEDQTAALYLQTVSQLEKLGYRQYEISNFSKPGMESRHNLNYWKCGEYIGLGPAAHSFYKGKRFFHPRDLEGYIRQNGQNFVPDGEGGSEEERLMLAMRLSEGVFPADYPGIPLKEKAAPFLKAGYLGEKDGRIFFTPQGFLLSNSILARLLPD